MVGESLGRAELSSTTLPSLEALLPIVQRYDDLQGRGSALAQRMRDAEQVTIRRVLAVEEGAETAAGYRGADAVVVVAEWQEWSHHLQQHRPCGVTVLQLATGGMYSGEGMAWLTQHVAPLAMDAQQVAAAVLLLATQARTREVAGWEL